MPEAPTLSVRALNVTLPINPALIPREAVARGGGDYITWYIDLEGMRFSIPASFGATDHRQTMRWLDEHKGTLEVALRGTLRCSPGYRYFELALAGLRRARASGLEQSSVRLTVVAAEDADIAPSRRRSAPRREAVHLSVDWLAASASLSPPAVRGLSEGVASNLRIDGWPGLIEIQFLGGECQRASDALAKSGGEGSITLRGKLLAERETGNLRLITATLSVRAKNAANTPPSDGAHARADEGRQAETPLPMDTIAPPIAMTETNPTSPSPTAGAPAAHPAEPAALPRAPAPLQVINEEEPMPEAEPIEAVLRPLIEEFTQKLTAAVTLHLRERVGAEVQAVVERAFGASLAAPARPQERSPSPAPSTPKLTVATRPARKRRRIAKLTKRTPEQVAKDDANLLEVIRANPGLRSLDLQQRIKLPPQDVASGLRRLRVAGKVTMEGEKSLATYTAAA